jgi:hypothetical protein
MNKLPLARAVSLVGVPIAVAAAISIGRAEPSTQPSTSPSATEVEPLIRQLGHGSFGRRQEAEDALVALGGAAREALQAAAADPNEERRARVASALARIEEADRFGATPVTVRFDRTPAGEALRQLYAQAGPMPPVEPANLFSGPPLPTVTLTAEREPFWKVMREITRQTGVDVVAAASGVRLVLAPADVNAGAAAWAGPYMFAQQRMTRRQERTANDVMLSFRVTPEPKLDVGQLAGPGYDLHIDEAVDDRGERVADAEIASDLYTQGGGWYLRVQFPSRQASRLTVLRGRVSLPAEVKFESGEAALPLNGRAVRRPLGGASFSITQVEVGDRKAAMTVDLTRGTAGSADWQHLVQTITAAVSVVDTDGKAWQVGSTNTSGDLTSLQFRVEFGRGDAGAAAKITWRLPYETRLMPVAFELRDVPFEPTPRRP